MATLILSKDHATIVRAGGRLFNLWEGNDGGLYIETPDRDGLTVTVSDDDESEITASGMWLTIRPLKELEVE